MNPTNMANIESVLGQLRQYQALAENSNSTTNPIQNEDGAGLFA